MTRLFSILIVISISSFSFAQSEHVESEQPTPPKHAVGLHAGFTTGVGFSYRFWPKKFGIQLTGVPFFNSKKDRTTVFMGVSLMYKVMESRRIDLFTYLGNHYSYRTHAESRHNAGLGFGMNIHNVINRMYFTFQGGYAIYELNKSPFSLITAEVGVYFRF